MVISKESNLVKIFNEIIEPSRTPKTATEVASVSFTLNKGITVNFDDNLTNLYIKDTTVDFEASADGMIIPIILSELSKNDSVELTQKESGEILVNDKWNIQTSSMASFRTNEIETPILSFTKEQYLKLENDYIFTVGNYFSNPKNTDCIGFVIKEGTVYEICPGASLYKLGKFDATIDSVEAQHVMNYDTKIYLFPRKIYNITKHFNETIKFHMDSEGTITISSDSVFVTFNCPSYGTNVFSEILSNSTAINDGIKASTFEKIVETIEPVLACNYKDTEDINVSVKVVDGTANIDFKDESSKISLTVENTPNTSFCVNANVLCYLVKNFPESVLKIDSSDFIYVQDGETFYRFANANIEG